MARKGGEWPLHAIYLGAILLLAGITLKSVESFTLTPTATRLLSRHAGPSTDTTEGAIQSIIVENTDQRHMIRPRGWVGWCLLSAGAVLVVHGVILKVR
ncbi:hypothetical protein [Blastopirellula retiformator]|uniref:Uncharacterized protein n=1 Tax=Blastopirellula retiformator TaxID=2527970 RepID=A0A5C5V4M2_9BACT|nr:hypothetical protein [Blastopirellula retiformator]TWT33281.1 hypothetical protein Enr8_31060 [Blastopirellula retiformator]